MQGPQEGNGALVSGEVGSEEHSNGCTVRLTPDREAAGSPRQACRRNSGEGVPCELWAYRWQDGADEGRAEMDSVSKGSEVGVRGVALAEVNK